MVEEEPSNVVVLRPGQDIEDEDRPLKIRAGERPGSPCYGFHGRVELDADAERVYCRDCGAEVPPFKALQMLARSGEKFINHRLEAERRMKIVRAELVDLEKRERNAKARVRNWAKKAPACDCAFLEKKYSPGPWCPMCGGSR